MKRKVAVIFKIIELNTVPSLTNDTGISTPWEVRYSIKYKRDK